MSIDTNFYATANELFGRASGGTIAAVVDYDSFISAGKKLADLSGTDLQNGIGAEIMNKIQRTVNDNPSYIAQLFEMDKGTLSYGIVEIMMEDFFTASQSKHDGPSIAEGNTYTDQFKVENLLGGNVKARYYQDSASWLFDVTVTDTDLRGALRTPEEFDDFIRKQFTAVVNSINAYKENITKTLFAKMITECSGETAEDEDENIPCVNYDLLAIYNEQKGTTLDWKTALLNDDFRNWSATVFDDVAMMMSKPTDQYSVLGDVVTFTPDSYCKLVINGVYDKNVKRGLASTYNTEYGKIGRPHEVVPFWQNSADRLRVTTEQSETEGVITTEYSPLVIALMYDKRACGFFSNLDDVTTDRNGKYRYTNYHYQFNWLLYWLGSANTVMFTLGDLPAPTPDPGT